MRLGRTQRTHLHARGHGSADGVTEDLALTLSQKAYVGVCEHGVGGGEGTASHRGENRQKHVHAQHGRCHWDTD